MKIMKLAIAAAALTSVTAIAVAQNGTPAAPRSNAPEASRDGGKDRFHMNRRLARLDANKDGSISQEEFATAKNLKEADTNGDGTLSTEELGAMIVKRQAERRAERMSRRLDIDGDGKVTIAEIEKNRGERFALMDRNDDGKLEGDELRHGGRGDGERFGRHGGRRHHEDNGKRWERQGDRDRGGPDDGDEFPMDL